MKGNWFNKFMMRFKWYKEFMMSRWYDEFENKLKVEGKELTREELQKAIDKGFDINTKNKEGMNLCMWAARCGKADTVRLLVEEFHVDVEARDNDGRTACMYAAGWNIETLRVLVKELKANINATDNDGKTVCMYAASQGRKDAVKLLVDEGANIDAQDNNNRTACMHAADDDNIETLFELVKLGADLTIADKYGETVFDHIKYMNCKDFDSHEDIKKKVIALRKEYEENHPDKPKMADDLSKKYLAKVVLRPVSLGPHTAQTDAAKETVVRNSVPQKN